MTASSSCSGTVDNFWSRDDIRVHTFGGTPKAVEALAEGSVRGQADPHRRREASRSGSGAAARLCRRSPRRKTALAARRHGADPDAKTPTTWNATSAWSLTPSCANCVSVNTRSVPPRMRVVAKDVGGGLVVQAGMSAIWRKMPLAPRVVRRPPRLLSRLCAHCEAVLKFVRILLEAFRFAPVDTTVAPAVVQCRATGPGGPFRTYSGRPPRTGASRSRRTARSKSVRGKSTTRAARSRRGAVAPLPADTAANTDAVAADQTA